MADFEAAHARVFAEEGGFVNDPDDPGGATNYGISLRWLAKQGLVGDINDDGIVDIQDILDMTPERSREIYKSSWWDRYSYGLIDGQRIANSLYSFSVNMGPRQAHKLLQRALLSCGAQLTVDGVLGPVSHREIGKADNNMLLGALRSEAACFYTNLVKRRPAMGKFLKGWLRRAYS